jgi:hypothetical protein
MADPYAGLLNYGLSPEELQKQKASDMGLLGLITGASILANNQPGVGFGQSVGQGVLTGANTYMAQEKMRETDALKRIQAGKLVNDIERQKTWAAQFSGNGGPGVASNLPSNIAPLVGMMGPEKGASFMASLAAKGTWKPEVRNGIPGQVNTMDGQWKPLDPTLAKVSVNGPTEQTEEQKKVGQFYGDQYIDMQKAGLSARDQNNKLDLLGTLLDKTYTGAGGESVQQLKKTAAALGISVEGVAEGDAAKAITNEMALQLRNPAGGAGMPGALSDRDRDFLTSMVPGLSQTPEGRKLLIESRKRLNNRNIEVAKMARDYRKKRGKLDEAFFDELADKYKDTNLFEGLVAPKKIAAVGQNPGGDDALINKYLDNR